MILNFLDANMIKDQIIEGISRRDFQLARIALAHGVLSKKQLADAFSNQINLIWFQLMTFILFQNKKGLPTVLLKMNKSHVFKQ